MSYGKLLQGGVEQVRVGVQVCGVRGGGVVLGRYVVRAPKEGAVPHVASIPKSDVATTSKAGVAQ